MHLKFDVENGVVEFKVILIYSSGN